MVSVFISQSKIPVAEQLYANAKHNALNIFPTWLNKWHIICEIHANFNQLDLIFLI